MTGIEKSSEEIPVLKISEYNPRPSVGRRAVRTDRIIAYSPPPPPPPSQKKKKKMSKMSKLTKKKKKNKGDKFLLSSSTTQPNHTGKRGGGGGGRGGEEGGGSQLLEIMVIKSKILLFEHPARSVLVVKEVIGPDFIVPK